MSVEITEPLWISRVQGWTAVPPLPSLAHGLANRVPLHNGLAGSHAFETQARFH